MKVEAVALASFIHGEINALEGKLCRNRDGSLIDSGVAGDLERAGLVRIRIAPAVTRVVEGKAADDGRGQPSSVLQAAPVLVTRTPATLTLGNAKNRPRDV